MAECINCIYERGLLELPSDRKGQCEKPQKVRRQQIQTPTLFLSTNRQREDDRGKRLMKLIDFLNLVGAVRNSSGTEYSGLNYYIFIHEDLKTATVNQSGYVDMSDVACVIVVCAYKWENFGYTNTSLTQLMMADKNFDPIDNIRFGIWNFKGLQFTTFESSWYDEYRPIPYLELSTDPSLNNSLNRPYNESDPFPKWEWPTVRIDGLSKLLESINEFVETFQNGVENPDRP